MPKLFMETDAVANLVLQMRSTVEELKGNNDKIKSHVDQTIPTYWEAGSSVQFQQKMEAYLQKYNLKADEWAKLADALQVELNEWQDTAGTLG